MKKSFTFAAIGRLCVWGFIVGLSGCASKVPAPVVERGGTPAGTATAAPTTTYTVKSGTHCTVSRGEHGMDFRELISLNNIENPNQIAVGRVLKIRPPGTTASSAVATTAPVSSDVVTVRPIESVGSAETGRKEREAGEGHLDRRDKARTESRKAPIFG